MKFCSFVKETLAEVLRLMVKYSMGGFLRTYIKNGRVDFRARHLISERTETIQGQSSM